MSIVIPFLAFLLAGAFAAYHRLRLAYWAAITASLLVACWLLGANPTATIVAALVVVAIAVPLLIPAIRKPLITAPALGFLRRALPPLSQTERIALETGSVGFEGDLFTGDPDWNKLLAYPKPQLTAEEQAFLDGPVEELCKMTNDWEITHVHADLPPELREHPIREVSSDWIEVLANEADRMISTQPGQVFDHLTREFESTLIRRALNASGGRRIEAAQILGIGRNTITRKIQELGME